MYSSFWWKQGEQFTYHHPGDPSTEPNNMRWFDYYQIDLRVAKAFDIMGLRTEFSVDIKNVLNLKFLNLLGGNDMIRYMENPNLPDAQRLPKTFDFSQPDYWEWYSYEVPPRQREFQLAISL